MDQLLKFGVSRLLANQNNATSSSNQIDDNNDDNEDIDIESTTTTPVKGNETEAPIQTSNNLNDGNASVSLYNSILLNALLLQLEAQQRQNPAPNATPSTSQIETNNGNNNGYLPRNYVEFYQPARNATSLGSNGKKFINFLCYIFHSILSGNSHERLLLAISDQSAGSNHQLINTLGHSLWPPSTMANFHPASLMAVDTPPVRPRKAAPRAVFSMLQRRGLERYFQQHKYISRTERRRISAALGLTDVQVKIWFQNRRMKWRQNSLPPDANGEMDQDRRDEKN